MSTNKYSSIVSQLFAGQTLFLRLEEGANAESLRTALSKEKTRQEEELRAFEIPVENSRLKFRHQKNGTYKVWIDKLELKFQILSEDEFKDESSNTD